MQSMVFVLIGVAGVLVFLTDMRAVSKTVLLATLFGPLVGWYYYSVISVSDALPPVEVAGVAAPAEERTVVDLSAAVERCRQAIAARLSRPPDAFGRERVGRVGPDWSVEWTLSEATGGSTGSYGCSGTSTSVRSLWLGDEAKVVAVP